MAGTAYHMEALRKTRVIERKNEAMKKLKESIGQKGDASGGQFDTGDTPLVFSEPGHYAQNRNNLEKFRVNSAGFNNRYRQRQQFAPHCDLSYAVVYPGKDNSDYIADDNRNNRRYNLNVDRFEMSKKHDGVIIDDSFISQNLG
ncbi:uncharacterized protein LOC127866724 isoform X1 [Dreissena polymorpha]|uniref:uncharacterized protein LOC127866724 isoform X1 n=1 Tax=Dreissena polymorpha TaxID=45954 RepID=UPI0022650AF4|nr:uncharacterized protein LOC127866724 isoform X1 [Dreissena polymorpha]